MTIKKRSAAGSRTKKPAAKERVGLGGGSVDRHLKRAKKKKKQAWYSVGEGNTATVRAVDPRKLFEDGYVHKVEFERQDGSTYEMDIRCLDPDDKGKPCPGCRDELERRYKFWMVVIVRNTVDDDGEPVNEEADGKVRILSAGNRLVKALNAKQRKRDLSKRDIEISQTGTGFDVEYEVDWATDEDEPLSEEDLELLESDEAKNVLESFEFHTTIRDEDDFFTATSRSNEDDEDEDIGERSKRRGSVFKDRKAGAKKTRRSVKDDDDDENDEEETPRRRRTQKSSGNVRKSSSVRKTSTTPTKRRRTR